MALISLQELNDAKTDGDTLEAVVNGAASPGTVTTRLGQVLKTLARIQQDVLAAAAVPIWAHIALGSGPVVSASSGGVTVQRVAVGLYKIMHASFTANTRVMLTPNTAGFVVDIYQYQGLGGFSGPGFIHIACASGGTLSDIGVGVNVMTFPQML